MHQYNYFPCSWVTQRHKKKQKKKKKSLYYLLESRCDVRSNTIIMRHVLFHNVTLWKPWRRQPPLPEYTSRHTPQKMVYVPWQYEGTGLLGGFYFQGSRHVWMILNVTLTEGLINTPNNNINESLSLYIFQLLKDSTKVLYCKHCSSHPTLWE